MITMASAGAVAVIMSNNRRNNEPPINNGCEYQVRVDQGRAWKCMTAEEYNLKYPPVVLSQTQQYMASTTIQVLDTATYILGIGFPLVFGICILCIGYYKIKSLVNKEPNPF